MRLGIGCLVLRCFEVADPTVLSMPVIGHRMPCTVDFRRIGSAHARMPDEAVPEAI